MSFRNRLSIHTTIRVTLLLAFMFVSMKSSIFALTSDFNDKKELNSEYLVVVSESASCGLDDDSCCCENVSVNHDCCCKSDLSGSGPDSIESGKSNNNIFKVFISSLKCSSGVPVYFQSGSLSDCEPSSIKVESFHFQEGSYIAILNSDYIAEQHLFLPFKPPQYSNNHTFNILT